MSSEPYYDIDEDWSLIVASFQAQYGIRLSKELSAMNWREFSYLINGLGADTPLGRVVSIRAETDPEIIKQFTPHQKQIRDEYRRKTAKQKSSKEIADVLDSIKRAFVSMADEEA